MKKAFFSAIALLVFVVTTGPVAFANDDVEQISNMIEIGADDSIDVPVAAGSSETVNVTPVMIEKDENGNVVGIRSVLGDRDIGWYFGLMYGRPLRVSVHAGLVIGKYDDNTGAVKGVVVEADVGQGGAAGHIGWGTAGENGSSMAVTVLRTFGNPWGALPGQTYIGARQAFSIFGIKIAAGVLYRVAGTESASKWLMTFGAGFTYGDIFGSGEVRRARKARK